MKNSLEMNLINSLKLCVRACKGVQPYSDPATQDMAWAYCKLVLEKSYNNYTNKKMTLEDLYNEILENFQIIIYGE